MARTLFLLATVPLLVAFGVAEGLWTNRWQMSKEAELAAARLKHIPKTVGPWKAREEELDAEQIEKAELSGYLMRTYVNADTGVSLSVLLLCGRPGPISVHTPDVCYKGAGYELDSPQKRWPVNVGADKPANFWVGNFRNTEAAVHDNLRIFWAWNATDSWTASDDPRWEFASQGFLYKLYVVRPVIDLSEPVDRDPTFQFLKIFVPQLREHLFPAKEGG
jgi:hypothetical protein